ncbi:protein kinase [Trypanosoma rangeli SC58]|uniref:Protein kinase n=1 Tax=Trypanosoma rangeli SC58 TaxID=429131 RepID=A0A061IV63_TRYRA|nr:protein kinase [Trypanosoma rangeli SC58]
MSDEDSETYLDTSLNRRCNFALPSNGCDEEEDAEALNSSTSTAGPPGSRRTGRCQCPSWGAASSSTSSSSPNSSAQPGYDRTGTFKHTGNYRSMLSKNNSSHRRRSLSNTSTVASLVGSYPEWGRSFCVYNPWRASSASRASFQYGQQLVFSGKHAISGTGASSPSSASPTAVTVGTPGCENHRRPVSFGLSLTHAAGVNGETSAGRSTSALFVAGQVLSSPASASPILGGRRSGGQSRILGTSSSPKTVAYYAMGGAMRQLNKGVAPIVPPVKRELAMLLRSFSAYLSLVGTPIINGAVEHPMDIRKGPLIGVGGFAKVYAGMDRVSGRLVAMKEINIAEITDHEALNAIGKEFGILKSLRHPNIVSYQLFEHSASQKVCRIVMELLTGGSTLALLERYGPLREAFLHKFARHLLEVIAFIHKEGISHRDIKPANILVSGSGVVKLCDFGCSRRVNELNKSTNCVIGTPLYMAPEFIKGESTHKSDIWSMACSLFELGTGLLPWHHAKIRDNLPLMFYITTSTETPLTNLAQYDVQEFSAEFKDFMKQCFTRDVQRRPEAVELLEHPWIKGDCSASPQNSFSVSSFGDPNTSTWSLRTSRAEEEELCQRELEELSANISIDMCTACMLRTGGVVPGFRLPSHLQQPQLQTEMRSRSDDVSQQQNPLEQLHLDSQRRPSTSQGHSPPVSLSGGGGGRVRASLSSTGALDATLNEQFNYSIPLGASEGRFVLPSCGASMSSVAPQFLCINDDGKVEYVNIDEEMVEVDTDVDDALAYSYGQFLIGSPSFNFALGCGSPTGASAAVHTVEGHSPYCSTSNLNTHNSYVAFSPARSSAGRNARYGPALYNPSMSLVSNSSFTSRGVSPSRRSQTASTASLAASQQLPALLPTTAGSLSIHAGASMNHSSDDVSAEVQDGAPASSTVSRFPEGIHEAGGRLHMSLSVPNGIADRRTNIELSIDPEDLHRVCIERRPSYVVALSEDLKSQLVAQMSEIASRSAVSSMDNQGAGGGSSTNCRLSRSAYAYGSQSLTPR